MSRHKRALLWKIAGSILATGLKGMRRLSHCGFLPFDLVQMFAHGLLVTPNARKCTYLTFEHLSIEKSVRNELLRLDDNVSVFVPYNVYNTSYYYVPEYKVNYDVYCTSGVLGKTSCICKEAVTTNYLATGSYHANKRRATLGDAHLRQERLKAFVGDSLCITVLCNGIFEQTRSGERRLIKLARKLADIPGIKVLIRQKPIAPAPADRSFYVDLVDEHPDIMLTHKEFDLHDFTSVTDLFVTSSSSAILEFCAVGKALFAVNFWHTADLFPWQTAVDGVFLDEDDAVATITQWCQNPAKRLEHEIRMKELSRVLFHPFPDFTAYKQNFRALLAEYLPNGKSSIQP